MFKRLSKGRRHSADELALANAGMVVLQQSPGEPPPDVILTKKNPDILHHQQPIEIGNGIVQNSDNDSGLYVQLAAPNSRATKYLMRKSQCSGLHQQTNNYQDDKKHNEETEEEEQEECQENGDHDGLEEKGGKVLDEQQQLKKLQNETDYRLETIEHLDHQRQNHRSPEKQKGWYINCHLMIFDHVHR